MIHLPLPQGSEAWVDAHLGIPTASNFHKIMSPKKRQPSAQATDLMYGLVAERIFKAPVVMAGADTAFMSRGRDLEQRAASWYEFTYDCELKVVGFCLDDSRRWGATPDRFCGDEGLVQIKCLSVVEHLKALDAPEASALDYGPQCQGEMMVAERSWNDLVFYNPALPSVRIRIERDEDYITDLRGCVVEFCSKLEQAERRLRSGYGLGSADPDTRTEATAGPPSQVH